LKVGQAFEKQDALDQPVGVLHLIDRFVLFLLLQAIQAPVAEHPGMKEVLVDCSQLVLQDEIQVLQDLGITLHCRGSSESTTHDLGGAASGAQRKYDLGSARALAALTSPCRLDRLGNQAQRVVALRAQVLIDDGLGRLFAPAAAASDRQLVLHVKKRA